MKLTDLLEKMESGISDLHLVVGEPPIFRNGGRLARTEAEPLAAEALATMLVGVLPERLQGRFVLDHQSVLTSVVHAGRRFRLSASWERGQPCAVLRAIPTRVPRLSELRIAEGPLGVLQRMAASTRGLIVVSGAAGSGKTTLMASLVEEINATRSERIYTLVESIDYEFTNQESFVTQQELGNDFHDFPQALRDLLYADPDVVMLGALTSLESIALALNLAETGHLVFVQVGQSSAVDALKRLVHAFPESNRAEVQRQLSNNLVGVVAQQLLPAMGGGRVPALELLLGVPAVRGKLRQGDFDLQAIIEESTGIGMQTMAQALNALVASGTITDEMAQSRMPVF
ncbi:type IV pilus twitching motility protein PilT [Armatimonas rosea]|uniref:Twitching motility protein PilT n=1 Tax=Armatimonas rosea TaxID=685828 RepID=A0A7W9SUJ5_ARMRO|nr:ATPase, T2SS/T4P/T4SS family [Armatimonas rosea]MBB6053097.1 twitching motility protein PilT [Armatimonas rosea]